MDTRPRARFETDAPGAEQVHSATVERIQRGRITSYFAKVPELPRSQSQPTGNDASRPPHLRSQLQATGTPKPSRQGSSTDGLAVAQRVEIDLTGNINSDPKVHSLYVAATNLFAEGLKNKDVFAILRNSFPRAFLRSTWIKNWRRKYNQTLARREKLITDKGAESQLQAESQVASSAPDGADAGGLGGAEYAVTIRGQERKSNAGRKPLFNSDWYPHLDKALVKVRQESSAPIDLKTIKREARKLFLEL